MKTKGIIGIVLALVIAFSMMNITAFAVKGHMQGDFTLNVPKIVVGTTASDVKEGITFADADLADNLEIVDVIFFDSENKAQDSITKVGKYNLYIALKLSDEGIYDEFAGKTIPGLPFKTYYGLCYLNGINKFTDTGSMIGTGYDLSKHSVTTEETVAIYCLEMFSFDAYDGIENLDLETTGNDSKEVVQKYDAKFTVNKTDVTKVQVSWTLEEIAVTVTNNKIWNTETLTWDVDKSKTNGAAASDPTATFNFVNLSSKDIYAEVTFEEGEDFSAPTLEYMDNDVAGDGIIKLGTKATSSLTDNTGKVELTLTVVDSDFDSTEAGSGTYGTYTVSISEKDPTKYNVNFAFDPEKFNYTGLDETYIVKAVSGTVLTYEVDNVNQPHTVTFTFKVGAETVKTVTLSPKVGNPMIIVSGFTSGTSITNNATINLGAAS